MNLVNQPFASQNVFNSIFDHTGIFEEGQLTSIIINDTNQSTITFPQETFNQHLDSLTDHVFSFSTHVRELKRTVSLIT